MWFTHFVPLREHLSANTEKARCLDSPLKLKNAM
jgi:hypothetical protein